jgi:DNA-binding transcriptional LysR family regulator
VELRHLRYFVAVAEELHFGRAAARLRIAQPPLSRQIHALEGEIGTELFDRSRRRVELTRAGKVLLDEVRRTFAQIDRAVDLARRAGRGESGALSIGFVSAVTHTSLPVILRAFRRNFGHVELYLREMSPADQVLALREGRIQVGFLRAPIDEPTLAVETILRERLVAALPVSHPLAARKRLALRALAREPFVLFPRHLGPGFYDQIIALCRQAGFSPRVIQEAPQMVTIASLVAVGLGVSVMPASVSHLWREGVAFLPLTGRIPPPELVMAWRPDDTSPVLHAFLNVVRSLKLARGHSPGI